MKVLVPIKQVAVLDDELELEDGRVPPDQIDRTLNEWDEFSVEAALQIREGAAEEVEVVVATVGDEDAEEALLAALANGADRGVRIWDAGFEDLDPLAVARILAAWAEGESADLVLCGVQSADAANGATGTALAAHLGLPRVAVVRALELDAPGSARVERELEGGTVEELRIPLPALLTIQTGINEPRYATLRQIKQARQKPLLTLSLAEIGLDAEAVLGASGARLRALTVPQQTSAAERLEGSAAEIAERIFSIAKEAQPA